MSRLAPTRYNTNASMPVSGAAVISLRKCNLYDAELLKHDEHNKCEHPYALTYEFTAQIGLTSHPVESEHNKAGSD
jgi:hypothetical protein